MLISGIWHGASIKYLIWGALHGLGMVAQNVLEKSPVAKRTAFSAA
jgi:D-alanyl-lipoteichoic acid acyltransferase DltB (MBOAT superfamily)